VTTLLVKNRQIRSLVENVLTNTRGEDADA